MQQVSKLCDASGLSLDKKITMLLAVQTLGFVRFWCVLNNKLGNYTDLPTHLHST
ncbi:hypothetical protein HCU66_23325 [Pseudomonas frederiksbergensis]|uniref:hypothetical protein n=1 Tax=Pseudomonas frederiksbergensis TaxID=104087 RepID=UPI001980271F|nr:hypothetical protein [Pseudomonas frederiksbergensis]MBN3865151.1 hypothetical protein [Pseudomonas frederiksbergensis]